MLYVTDPPTKISYDSPPTATFLEPYDLPCPLQGNPQPSCTWNIVYCSQLTPVDLGTTVTYKDNNCTLSIGVLNANYANLCFYCNATNALAPNPVTAFIHSIPFSSEYFSSVLWVTQPLFWLVRVGRERGRERGEKERRKRSSERKTETKGAQGRKREHR